MSVLKNRGLVLFVLVVFSISVSGCGTLMYPARKSATPSGVLDTKVVILDCLWLIAGVVPGVVALAIDFVTGAAYYSEGEAHASAGDTVVINLAGVAPEDAEVTLRLFASDGRDLTRPAFARAVAGEKLDEPLSLTIPTHVDTSTAKLLLATNGRPQVTWTLVN